MRLIFEWIGCDERKLFRDCGVNFTDDYFVTYHRENGLLSIRRRPSDIASDFYVLSDPVVSQITCFVGKNGSGKTSILKHLFKSDPCTCSDSQMPRAATVEVYEFEDGLHVYSNVALLGDPANRELPVPIFYESGGTPVGRVSKVFFTNNFLEGVRGGLAGGDRALIAFTPYDMHMLQSEFFDRISATGLSPAQTPYALFEKRAKEYANPMHLYNVFYLLFLRKLFQSERKGEFGYLGDAQLQFLPIGETDAFIDPYNTLQCSAAELKYIVACGVSAAATFEEEHGMRSGRELRYLCAVCKWAERKCSGRSVLARNLVAELLLSLAEYGTDLSSLPSYEPENLLEMVKERARGEAKAREIAYLERALQSVRRAEGLLGRAKKIKLSKNAALLSLLEEELRSGSSFLLKYIWVSVNCSSGERAFLNIFASLNFIPYLKYFSGGDRKGDIVLFLDEPDLYCHPEWQRKLLRHLIGMFEALYRGRSVHIIMSTHSPLFLSDIPNGNILLLERKGRGLTVRPMCRPSFGANLFDLYNDGFFTEDFIGEFAKEKIERAIRALQMAAEREQGEANREELRKFIGLIGEPILRGSLNKMLEQKYTPKREERE